MGKILRKFFGENMFEWIIRGVAVIYSISTFTIPVFIKNPPLWVGNFWTVYAFFMIGLVLIYLDAYLRTRPPKQKLRIEFKPGKEPFEHKYSESSFDNEKDHKLFRIRVINQTDEHLPECLVRLERIETDVPYQGGYCPVGLITQHQHEQERKGGTFKLRGKDDDKFINVVWMHEGLPDSEVHVYYETDQYANGMPWGVYRFHISASGGSGAKSWAVFKVVSKDGELHFEQEK